MHSHKKDIVVQYSGYFTPCKWFIDDSTETLTEFLSAFNIKSDRIKLTYNISDNSISFRGLFLYVGNSSSELQFSTFQKPLHKYLYIYFKSFHPSSIKNASIEGELRRWGIVSLFWRLVYKFWRRLRLDRGRGGTPLLRGILFTDRTRLLKFKNRSESKIGLSFLRLRLTAVTHSGIKDAINRILSCLKWTVCYCLWTALTRLGSGSVSLTWVTFWSVHINSDRWSSSIFFLMQHFKSLLWIHLYFSMALPPPKFKFCF